MQPLDFSFFSRHGFDTHCLAFLNLTQLWRVWYLSSNYQCVLDTDIGLGSKCSCSRISLSNPISIRMDQFCNTSYWKGSVEDFAIRCGNPLSTQHQPPKMLLPSS